MFRKFRYYLGGCPPFLCKFVIAYSALDFLVAITASWTSHAKMTDQDFGPGRMACRRGLPAKLVNSKQFQRLVWETGKNERNTSTQAWRPTKT